MEIIENSVCVYCGGTENLTHDHIPPKCLFTDPKPNDLITIPACFTCNNEYSKDDEYFSTILTMSSPNPDAKQLIKKLKRAARRRPAMLKSILRSVKKTHVMTYGGIYMGIRPTFDIDTRRVWRIVVRIVRGLIWHQYHQRPHEPTMFYVYDLTYEPREFAKFVVQKCGNYSSIGNGLFQYAYGRAHDLPGASLWVLAFYGSHIFSVLVFPPNIFPQGSPG